MQGLWSRWPERPERFVSLIALGLSCVLVAETAAAPRQQPPEGSSGQRLYLPALRHVSPSPPLEDWTIVGHLGGPVSAVEVVLPYAYVGMAYGLTVFDVSDPTRPRQVGRLGGLSGDEWPGLDEAGGRIYVAGDVLGLGIVDVSRPSAPRLTARVGDLTADVVRVSGDHAYVLSRQGALEIVDLSRVEAPRRLGRLELEGDFSAMDVAGGVAYLVEFEDPALSTVDVSSPGAPRLLARARLPLAAWGIQVVGALAYLADLQGLRIVDVSEPSDVQTTTDHTVTDGATDVVVAGGRIYLAGGDGLEVLDVSRPPWISSLAYAKTEGDPSDLEVVDGMAYLAEGRGLRVIDVRTPDSAVPQGGFRLPVLGGFDVPGIVDDVEAFGDFAVATDIHFGLAVFDLSVPRDPRLVAQVPLQSLSDPEATSHPWAIEVRGGYAFVAADEEDGEDGSLRVFDLADPLSPQPISAMALDAPPIDLALAGDWAYVLFVGELLVLDVSAPASPRIVGRMATAGPSLAIHVSGGLAAIAKHMAGMELVDVSDPAKPRSLATLDTAGLVTAVALHGATLLATDARVGHLAGGTDLILVDVSTPTAPKVLATMTLEGHLEAIEVDFPRAYIGGHQLVDISNPAAPRLVRMLPVTGKLRVHGRLGYVASQDGGLSVLALGPR